MPILEPLLSVDQTVESVEMYPVDPVKPITYVIKIPLNLQSKQLSSTYSLFSCSKDKLQF